MAINPNLVSITPASELPTGVPTSAGQFFFYEGNEMKKSPMTEIYELVSGSQSLGTITPSSTIPTEGNVWGFAGEGTYPNAGNITVAAGKIAILSRIGTTWSKVDVELNVPNGKVEEGNTQAVSGGEVYSSIEKNIIDKSTVIYVNPNNLADISKFTTGYVSSVGVLNDLHNDYRKLRIDGLQDIATITFNAKEINGYNPSSSKNFVFFDENDVFLSRSEITALPIVLSVPSGAKYAYTNVYVKDDGDVLANITDYEIMVNIGNSPLPYENYSLKKYIGDVYGADFFNKKYDFVKNENDTLLGYDNLSCICRNIGGTWQFVFDNDHSRKNISSITNITNGFRITYSKIYDKILSLSGVTDEAYALNGIYVGASVGNGYADFNFSCGGLGGVIGNDLIIENSGFANAIKSVSESDGEITITHSNLINSIPLVSTMFEGERVVITDYTNSYIKIKIYDVLTNTLITDFSNTKFSVSRNGVRQLTNSEMDILSSNFLVQGLMCDII